MSTPTTRTDSVAHRGHNESAYIAEMTELARTLERELAAERIKLRAMRAALESVADAWHASHETNPFRAGDVMLEIAEKALGGAEGDQ
jgi:hypothetical protein